MDKEEFRIKLEEINKLVEKKDYRGAMQIVDSIDWRRVKNVRTLCVVGEIYAANKRYEDSKEIFLLAYHRAPIGKSILYRLIEVSLKMKDLDEAQEFYEEFLEVAPNDNTKYILHYKILSAKKAPIAEQIAVLEEYKEREYTERWSYELAKLYYKADQREKCIEVCDDLILWFNEGKYVTKALDLKMRLGALTESQREKYEEALTPKLLTKEELEELEEKQKEEPEEEPEAAEEKAQAEEEKTEEPEEGGSALQEKIVKGIRDIFGGRKKESEEETEEKEETAEKEIENMLEDYVSKEDVPQLEPERNAFSAGESRMPEEMKIPSAIRIPEPVKAPEVAAAPVFVPSQEEIEAALRADEEKRLQIEEEQKRQSEEKQEEETAVEEEAEEAVAVEEPAEELAAEEDTEEPAEEPAAEEDTEEPAEESAAEKAAEEEPAAAVSEETSAEEETEEEQPAEGSAEEESPEAGDMGQTKEFTFNLEDTILAAASAQGIEVPDDVPEPEVIPEEAAEEPAEELEPEELPEEPAEPEREETEEERLERFIDERNAEETDAALLIPREMKLSDEEKKLFTYFSSVPGIPEQLVEALVDVQQAAAEKTSRTGNVIIMGAGETGKTRLSQGFILAACKELHMEAAKTATITGSQLNEMEPAEVVNKLSGGFLLIQGAASMTAETIEKLNSAMEFRTDGLTVIIEDEKIGMRKLIAKYEKFAEKFTSMINIPVFTNDELVRFAKIYTKENGYVMDQMGVLALYNLIGDNQKEDEPMTIGKVKEMLDDAINRAESGTRKFRRNLSKKRTDEDGRIILYEKDFG